MRTQAELLEREQWTAALASGDAPRVVFDAFVRAEGPYVLGVVQRFLGNVDDAREVTQDAFLKAFLSLRGFRGDCALRTWVTRIALHQAQRRLRRRRLREAVLGLFSTAKHSPLSASPQAAADDAIDLRAQAAALARALLRLPPKQALVLSLRYQEGLTLPEISALLGVEPSTVKTHLFRALDRVRAEWPPAGGLQGAP